MQMTLEEWLRFFEKEDVYAFCAKIAENPDDLAPKLVFADWLEENCPVNSFPENYRKHLSGENPKLLYPFCETLSEEDPFLQVEFYRGRMDVEFTFVQQMTDAIQRLCQRGIVSHLKAQGEEIDKIQGPCPLLHSLTNLSDFCWEYAEKGYFSAVTEFVWSRNHYVGRDRGLAHLLNSTDYCRHLLSLTFTEGHFWAADTEALTNSPHPVRLKRLAIDDETSVGEFALVSEKFDHLESLVCFGHKLDMKAFLDSLANKKGLTRLREFRLSLDWIEEYDWEYFFQAKHFASLWVLDLRDIPKDTEFYKALAQSHYLRGLQQLILDKSISPEAKKLLAESPYLSEKIKRQFQS